MAFNDFFRVINSKKSLKMFLPIAVAYFFFAFGWGIVTPIFSIFINNITKDLFLTGIIIGIWGLIGLFVDLPFGILIDKISPKKIIQICLAAYMIITIAYTFATNFWNLLTIRIIHSIFGALMWIAVWAYIYSKVQKVKAAQEIGLFSEFYDIGATAAPLLGGVIVVASFFAPFYLLSIFCFISFFVVTIFMQETRNQKTPDGYWRLMKKELSSVSKLGYTLVYLVVFIVLVFSVNTIVWGFLPILLKDAGVSYGMIGLTIAAATLPAVLLEVPVGWFVDRVRKEKAAALGVLIFALCTFILSKTIYAPIVVVVMFFFGMASVLLVLLVNKAASELTIKDGRGGFTGVITFFKDVGNFVGPMVGGLALKLMGSSKTMFILAIVSLTATLPFYLALKGKPSK